MRARSNARRKASASKPTRRKAKVQAVAPSDRKLRIADVLKDPAVAFEAAERDPDDHVDIEGDNGGSFYVGFCPPNPKPTAFRPGIDSLPARPTHKEFMGQRIHEWQLERRSLATARDCAAKRSLESSSQHTDVHAMARLLARICDVDREIGGAGEAERNDLVRAMNSAADTLHFALSTWRDARESTYGKLPWASAEITPTLAREASQRCAVGALERVVFELTDRAAHAAQSLLEASGERAHAHLARTLTFVRVVLGRMQVFGPVGADLDEAGNALDEAGNVLAALVADWEKHRAAFEAAEYESSGRERQT